MPDLAYYLAALHKMRILSQRVTEADAQIGTEEHRMNAIGMCGYYRGKQ
jgi:hypothetical protein